MEMVAINIQQTILFKGNFTLYIITEITNYYDRPLTTEKVLIFRVFFRLKNFPEFSEKYNSSGKEGI